MVEATRNSQQPQTQEQHILVIDDHDCGVFALDAATYSIGRDSNNAIVLNDPSVSRRHALLLRMPIPGENRYRYRLIDGNSKGKPSTNGTIVNGEPCQSHELIKGDSIQFGKNSFCTYLIISGEETEISQYLNSAEFQSIKGGVTDPKATLWLEEPIEPEQEDATGIFAKRSAPANHPSTSQEETAQPRLKQNWKTIALGAGLATLALTVGLWRVFQPQPQAPTPSESNVTAPEQ